MTKQSKNKQNALRRAKCKAKRMEKKLQQDRLNNEAKFNSYWNNLEKTRCRSRKLRKEKKARDAQAA